MSSDATGASGARRAARRLALAALALGALAALRPRGETAAAPVPPPPAPPPADAAPAPVAAAPVRRGPRGLSCALLSAVLPGAGQVHGGRRRRGIAMMAVVAALVAAGAVIASRGTLYLLDQAVRPEVLIGALAANGAILLFRAGAAADAWRLGRRPSPTAARAALLAALLVLVAAPHVLVGWYQWTAYDTITTVFDDDEAAAAVVPGLPFQGGEARAPRPAPPAPAWPDRRRLTVLLLGGDAGPGRSGLRTDTMVVATIDTETGRTAMLSLPRNLADVPLPPAAAGLVPGGRFPDILNALYGWAHAHPGAFPGKDPGATALKQVAANMTGLRIDYYALVDFRGFVEVVDALGGVTIDVPRPVLDRVSPPDDGDWIRIDLPAGRRHLTAREAFAYVRARSQSSDDERIRRQRCVLGALAGQAQPVRLLRALPSLARTMREYVSTDIPRRALPDLIRLMSHVDAGHIVSVGFTPPTYTSGWVGPGYPVPDIEAIRAASHRAATATAPTRAARDLSGEVCSA
ncbi:MAG: LCP family protein [Thermoleophilia bacterium]